MCEAKSLRKPHAYRAIQGKEQQLALVSLSSLASSDVPRAVISVVNERAQWRVELLGSASLLVVIIARHPCELQ